MYNLKANTPVVVVSKRDISFASAGLNGAAIRCLYDSGKPVKSYFPTRGLNTLTNIQAGKGYLVYPSQNKKVPAFLTPVTLGPVLSYDFKAADAGRFDQSVKGGESFTYGSTGLTYTGTGATAPFSYLTSKASYVSENYTLTLDFKINGAATTTGFALWIKSSGLMAKFGYYLTVAPGANKMQLHASNPSTGGKGVLMGETAFTFIDNEVCRLTVVRAGADFTCSVSSITTPLKFPGSITYTYLTTYSAFQSSSPSMPNTHTIGLQMYAGNFLFTSLVYSSDDYKNINCAFVGDSIMQGHYVSQFTDRLSYKVFNGDRRDFATLAGGGDTTTDVLARINEIKALKPLYALLCIGTNDFGLSVPVDQFTANITAIDTVLKADDITPIWATLPAGVNATAYNSAIESLPSKVVDFYTATLNTSTETGLATAYNGGDGIHLTSSANLMLANKIKTECPEIL